jgi:predicted nucleic acid-binding protein
MIIVDTSVWVATLRDASDPAAPRLRALLDADDVALPLPVRVELLAGVARPHRAALKRALSALPVLIPSEETWRILERWIEPAAEQGQRFGVADLLIAALADEFGGMIWSLDADFDRLERLGFARLL